MAAEEEEAGTFCVRVLQLRADRKAETQIFLLSGFFFFFFLVVRST